jgi:hypothetical protein
MRANKEYLHGIRNSSQHWKTDVGQGCIVVNRTAKEKINKKKTKMTACKDIYTKPKTVSAGKLMLVKAALL